MLYAGTGHGFFYSLDDGQTWTQFKDRLPAAPVNWIEVPLNAPEVVVATYGRGVWILRDVWQIEQAGVVQQAGVQLYKPRQATRTADAAELEVVFGLPSASTVMLDVMDAAGEPVTSVEVQGRTGLNEYTLDLLYPEPDQPILRSLPPDNPHIWEAGRWEGRERPVTHWGLGAARWRTRVAPGEYTLRLSANGQRLTQPFKVVRDPVLMSTTEDLVAGTGMQLRVVEAINEVVDRINRIEIMRAQVEDLRGAHANDRALDRDLEALHQRMYDTELHFLSRTEMHSDDKWYVEKYRLYMNLVWLLAELGGGGGDVAGGVAYRPTDAAVGVFQDRLTEMEAARADFDRLLAEVEAFNRSHAGRLPAISDRRPIS
jgi:hypothetical protein